MFSICKEDCIIFLWLLPCYGYVMKIVLDLNSFNQRDIFLQMEEFDTKA